MITMGDVLKFTPRPQDWRAAVIDQNTEIQTRALNRQQLAAWLHDLADHVAADEMEVEPVAVMLVATGVHASEFLHFGYGREGGPVLSDAQRVADRYVARYNHGVQRDGIYTHT